MVTRIVEQQQDRRTWELNWEYLKRNARYKRYCEYMRKKSKNPNVPIPNEFLTADKYSPDEAFEYHRFGDVHRTNFDDWWRGKESKIIYYPPSIEDYTETFEHDFGECVRIFKSNEGREPTLEELKKSPLRRMRLFPQRLYLKVTLSDDITLKDLQPEFKAFIKKRKRDPFFLELEYRKKRYMRPTAEVIGRDLRLDELQRYLEVYDKRAPKPPMKWDDIINTISPKADPNSAEVRRAFRMDMEKARRIITNVGAGFFPGQYEK